MKKRGVETSAGNIATLVALIALFIVLYILLLPQEARNDLLGPTDVQLQNVDGSILFSEFLGTLDPLENSREVTHKVGDVNLFSEVSADSITLGENLFIENGLFDNKEQSFIFNLDEPSNVERANLLVVVGKTSGNLGVFLNDVEIFNDELGDNSQRLINLPLAYLSEKNVVDFVVSEGVFSSNVYELNSVILRNRENVVRGETVRVFSLPDSEIKSLSNAELSYDVFCSAGQNELLEIFVNNRLVYSDVPFCNLEREKIELDSSYLDIGANDLQFKSTGDYVVSSIKIKSSLDEEEGLEHTFKINDQPYRDVKRGTNDVVVVFEFSVSDDRKIMDMYVNDNFIEIDTTENQYFVTISDYLDRGNNFIRLDPKNKFEVITFEARIV